MKKNLIERLLPIIASLTWAFLFGIMLILFTEGTPVVRFVSPVRFIFGLHWYPVHDPPEFGILPLILGSLMVTGGAILVALPLGVGCAVYIAELAHPRAREIIKPLTEMLAGVPSIIYGFFGMVFLAPIIRRMFDLPTGLTGGTAAIILGIMALPTVASIAEDSISSVPRHLREASYALGANQWETITRTVIPAARSGILTAVILGIGRAIGETMTVLMVAGGSAVIPHQFFTPVRPMTSTIAAEMGEAPMGGMHYHALFAIGLVLFFITLSLSLVAEWVKER